MAMAKWFEAKRSLGCEYPTCLRVVVKQTGRILVTGARVAVVTGHVSTIAIGTLWSIAAADLKKEGWAVHELELDEV